MSRFEIVPHAGGYLLEMDGLPQSHVDLEDPRHLAMEYMAHLAAVLRGVNPPAPAPLRVTHVGGAAMTMPRWVQDVRPGSPQIVLEPDAELTEAVRRELPLPRGHRIRVRAQTGEEGVPQLKDGSADLVLVDAFAGGVTVPGLTTLEMLTETRRVLGARGVVALNIPDHPQRRFVARVLATLETVGFGHLGVITHRSGWDGKRFANHVVVAWDEPSTDGADGGDEAAEDQATVLDRELVDAIIRDESVPARARWDDDLAGLRRSAAPLTAADPMTSDPFPETLLRHR